MTTRTATVTITVDPELLIVAIVACDNGADEWDRRALTAQWGSATQMMATKIALRSRATADHLRAALTAANYR